MTVNDALIRQNFINKVLLKNGDESLSRDLKVKIMSMRIELSKVRKSLEADAQEFVRNATPEEFTTLQQKTDRTEEENTRLQELVNTINDEYNTYIQVKSREEVTLNNPKLTENEYNEIVTVMGGEDVEINGQHINSTDYLENLYNLFVEN